MHNNISLLVYLQFERGAVGRVGVSRDRNAFYVCATLYLVHSTSTNGRVILEYSSTGTPDVQYPVLVHRTQSTVV